MATNSPLVPSVYLPRQRASASDLSIHGAHLHMSDQLRESQRCGCRPRSAQCFADKLYLRRHGQRGVDKTHIPLTDSKSHGCLLPSVVAKDGAFSSWCRLPQTVQGSPYHCRSQAVAVDGSIPPYSRPIHATPSTIYDCHGIAADRLRIRLPCGDAESTDRLSLRRKRAMSTEPDKESVARQSCQGPQAVRLKSETAIHSHPRAVDG